MALFLITVSLCFLSLIHAENCPGLPSINTLTTELKNQVISSGGEGSSSILVTGGPHYTCQVQGTTMGTYQELSVILEYRQSGSTKIGQFELVCVAGGIWMSRTESLTTLIGTDIDLRTDCSSCINTAGNDNNCVGCHSSCNSGLMRCTGSGSDDCCVIFEDDGVCSSTLNCSNQAYVANSFNNYTCSCESSCPDGYTLNSTSCTCTLTDICVADNPCNNNGVCTLESSPDQYTCNCTGTGYTGTNCTVCPECPDGYTMFSSNCSCYQSHTCLIDNPCNNGGNCMIQDGDSNYTCSCINNYHGPNCTECSMDCDDGYIATDNCSSCILADICVADNPCNNGGVCTLGSSPDQYTCNCTGTGYTGTNCTDCALQCSNGGTVMADCSSCICSLNYMGNLCDTPVNHCEDIDTCGVNGVCVNDYDINGYKCSCRSGWAGPTCTECTIAHCNKCTSNPTLCLSCDQGYEPSPSGHECILNDLCPLSPCLNNGSCRSVPGSYRCDCTDTWDGINCTECAEGYGKRDKTCVPCDLGNCQYCTSDYRSCTSCMTGYSLNSDKSECLFEANRYTLIWIIVCAVVGGLLILIIVLIIVMASIRIAGRSGSKPSRVRKTSAFQRGIVNNNPLYVSTDDLKDEEEIKDTDTESDNNDNDRQ